MSEHGSAFIPGVIVWLERFSPTPRQASNALRPLLQAPLDSRFARALATFSRRQTPLGRYRLVGPLIEWPARRSSSPRLLWRSAYGEHDPDGSRKRSSKRSSAPPTTEPEAVLRLWRTFEPEQAKHRRILIRKVFMPLCEHGVGGYELCRRYLNLCKEPPRGPRRC